MISQKRISSQAKLYIDDEKALDKGDYSPTIAAVSFDTGVWYRSRVKLVSDAGHVSC